MCSLNPHAELTVYVELKCCLQLFQWLNVIQMTYAVVSHSHSVLTVLTATDYLFTTMRLCWFACGRDGDFMELIEEPELMGYQEASSESAAAGPLYDSTLLGATNSSSSSSAASDINHHAREFTQWELIS